MTKPFSELRDEVRADPERLARVEALVAELREEIGENTDPLANLADRVTDLEVQLRDLIRLLRGRGIPA